MPSRIDSFALRRLSRVVTWLSFLVVVGCILTEDAAAFALIPRLPARLLVGTAHPPKSSSIGRKSRPWTTIRPPLSFLSITDDPSSADFSSPYYWEGFYKQQVVAATTRHPGTIEPCAGTSTRPNDTHHPPAFAYDWHESIPLQDLAHLIPAHSRCLMVGCGNSRLPQVVLERHENVHLTLLDTSPTCVEQLQARYHQHKEKVECVCASATAMSSYFQQQDNSTGRLFDMIVDKGLTDAFMCGDAWEKDVEDLLRESTRVLNTDAGGGMYLLVSYKLSPTVQDQFQQLTDKIGGDSVQWCWDFDIESLSNHRVSVSMARVTSTQPSR